MFSPLVRESAPVRTSAPTIAPEVKVYVSPGSAAPYTLLLAAAVTVIALALIVKFADTKVSV